MKYAAFDLDYNELPVSDYFAEDDDGEEFHVIPFEETRKMLFAVSVVDGVLRFYLDAGGGE